MGERLVWKDGRPFLIRKPRPQRVMADGLAWCAECHRAVDRGWDHDRNCREGNWGEAEWTAPDLLSPDVARWRFQFPERRGFTVAT